MLILSHQVLFSYLKLVLSCLPGIICDPAAGICWINCLTENLPLWIKSCWQFIVEPQVSVLTSTALPCVCVCMCAALAIPVSHQRLHCMEAGSRYSLCLSHWQRRERTDVRQRYPVGKLQYIKDAQESEQQPAGRTAERMQERINTFETVLNIDQFLVRFIILYIEMFCNSFCEDWCIHDLNER